MGGASSHSLSSVAVFGAPLAEVILSHPVYATMPTHMMFRAQDHDCMLAELSDDDVNDVTSVLMNVVHQKHRKTFCHGATTDSYQRYILNTLSIKDSVSVYGSEGHMKTLYRLSMFIGAVETSLEYAD